MEIIKVVNVYDYATLTFQFLWCTLIGFIP